MSDFDNEEFAIANVKFLSTKPNSHGLGISPNVLRECAPTVLGKWLVAKYDKYASDATDHDPTENIMGIFPSNQEIVFTDEDGYLVASANVVLSKVYASEIYEMFQLDNFRDVSVEMKVESHFEGSVEVVDSFKIVGVTILGKRVNGSCPDANMEIIRFSQENANKFYNEQTNTTFDVLKRFSEERRKNMADKTYKVNKTELKETPWGDVDKTKLRNAVVEAKNKAELVKSVYLVVEDGWEDAPSEKLKYPVMELVGDTFYYNRYGLKSALGYAKAEGDNKVVSEIEKLYKKFDLDDKKEDEAQMSDTKNFEIEGREAWGDVIKKVQDHEGKEAYVESVEKDHIIYTKGDVRYRVEAKVEVGEDDKSVKAEINWESVKKDADQKMSDDDVEMQDDAEEMSADANVDPTAHADMLKEEAEKNQSLVDKLAEKENIIMEYEKELKELRQFKCDMEDKEKCSTVATAMAEVKEFIDDTEFESLKKEGMACDMSELAGWTNKIKSVAFEAVKNHNTNNNGIWSMSNPDIVNPEPKGLWG